MFRFRGNSWQGILISWRRNGADAYPPIIVTFELRVCTCIVSLYCVAVLYNLDSVWVVWGEGEAGGLRGGRGWLLATLAPPPWHAPSWGRGRGYPPTLPPHTQADFSLRHSVVVVVGEREVQVRC